MGEEIGIWKPARYRIGVSWLNKPAGVELVDGYEHLGLGMHIGSPPLPVRGRRKAQPPIWHLTHLETGHLIHRLRGDVATAFPVATEIAECADWTFSSLYGWKDRDPDLPKKVLAIAGRNSGVVLAREGVPANEATAREIAHDRA